MAGGADVDDCTFYIRFWGRKGRAQVSRKIFHAKQYQNRSQKITKNGRAAAAVPADNVDTKGPEVGGERDLRGLDPHIPEKPGSVSGPALPCRLRTERGFERVFF